MRIKSNLESVVAIEFYRLSNVADHPEYFDSFFLLPKEEIEIFPELLGNSNFITLFRTCYGVILRYLEKDSKTFKSESELSGDFLSLYLPGGAYEPTRDDVLIDTIDPSLCVISEKAR